MDIETELAFVDVEVTGFDPNSEQIIELAIKTYKILNGRLEASRTFEALFKPSKPVSPRILDLTGIDPINLDNAESLESYRSVIEEMLSGKVIVGHGLSLDLAFLTKEDLVKEVVGLDTLELAQIFLPTQHSYNLESLSYELGRENTGAHRAMADVEATVYLLERLSEVFWSLPEGVREKFLNASVLNRLGWMSVFSSLREIESKAPELIAAEEFAPEGDSPVLWAEPAHVLAKSYIVSHSNLIDAKTQAKALGGDHAIYKPNEISFSGIKNVENDLDNCPLQLIIGYLKVLVYLAKHDEGDISELNWLPLGKDIASTFIKKRTDYPSERYIHTDFTSIYKLADRNKILLIQDPLSFYQWLEFYSGNHISWQGMLGVLSPLYTETEAAKDQTVYVSAMTAIDVAFGSIVLSLRQELRVNAGTFEFTDLSPYIKERIVSILDNLKRRIEILNSGSTPELGMLIERLQGFTLDMASSKVCWVEFSDIRCSIFSKDLSLHNEFSKIESSYKLVEFIQPGYEKSVNDFIYSRLELQGNNFIVADQNRLKDVNLHDRPLGEKDFQTLSQVKDPSVWVFPDKADAKNLYDEVLKYEGLGFKALVQGVHGGPHKLATNFQWKSEVNLWLSSRSLALIPNKYFRTKTLYWAINTGSFLNDPYIKALYRQHPGFASGDEWLKKLLVSKVLESLRLFSQIPKIILVPLDDESVEVGNLILEELRLS